MVIVALGDSTTAGTPGFLSPIEAPPDGRGDIKSQYAYWLMQWHKDWTVLNRGVNGERTDQIAARFDRDVLAHTPDVVVVIAGVNDVYQGRPTDHVKTQLAAMYLRAREKQIRVVAGTIIPYNTATPAQNAAMHDINVWIRLEAERHKIGYVDTRAAVASPDDPDRLASTSDQLHPDARGYEAMARAIERVLRSSELRPEN
jgi:lysophospholipase L1-like esterase